jgi:hypothetical protein
MDRQPRIVQVQALRRIAAKYKIDRCPDVAGQEKVTTMYNAIRACPTLSEADAGLVSDAWHRYQETWPTMAQEPAEQQPQEQAEKPKWQLHAG